MSLFQALKSKVSELGLFEQQAPEKKLTKDEVFRAEFHLPESQTIQMESIAEVTIVSKDSICLSGKLYLCEKYLVFKDGYSGRDMSFVLHLSTIRNVERMPSKAYVFGLVITTFSQLRLSVQFIGIRSNSETFSLLLKKALDTNSGDVRSLKPFLRTLYSEYLFAKNSKLAHASATPVTSPEIGAGAVTSPQLSISSGTSFSLPEGGLGLTFKFPGDPKKLKDKPKTRLWFKYMQEHGRNLALVRTEMFYKLVRVGLPNRLRGELWELCSGSIYERYANKGLYAEILEANKDKKSVAIEEIEKDLNRSLPEYPAYQDPEGISRLRRVLTAYSWRNPEVGYCQAMNIVVALLLVYMSEEQAFFCLCNLCDNYTPGYYSKTMYGTLLDQRVFEALVEKTMPILWEHVVKNDIQLSIVSLPWFLSLFINSMPLVFCSRIVDILFLQGPKTLFQVALGILRVNGEKLLRSPDDGAFISVIKDYFNKLDESAHPKSKNESFRQITNFQELLVVAFNEFKDIDDTMVQQYRRKHKNSVYQNIESFVKRTQIRNLPKLSNLSPDTVSCIYDNYYSVLEFDNVQNGGADGSGSGSDKMHFAQFEKFMSQITLWTVVPNITQAKNQENFLNRLFISWDTEFQGCLGLADICLGLNKWCHNDLMHLIKVFFELYDNTGSGLIDKEGMLQMSEGLIFLTTPWREGWVFDPISQKEIDTIVQQRMAEYQKQLEENMGIEETVLPPNLAVDEVYFKHKQAERYLSAASNFLQNCFEYARPVEPSGDLIDLDKNESDDDDEMDEVTKLAKEVYIDEKTAKDSEKIKANKALDPDLPLQMDLPTFRMVILADETYEMLFAKLLSNSIDVKPLENKKKFNLRGMFNTLVADGRKVAGEVKKRIDAAGQRRMSIGEEDDDEEDDELGTGEQDKEEVGL